MLTMSQVDVVLHDIYLSNFVKFTKSKSELPIILMKAKALGINQRRFVVYDPKLQFNKLY